MRYIHKSEIKFAWFPVFTNKGYIWLRPYIKYWIYEWTKDDTRTERIECYAQE